MVAKLRDEFPLAPIDPEIRLNHVAPPQTCLSGTFAGEGSSSCQDCVAGEYSVLDGMETCELCPLGTYVDVAGTNRFGSPT